MGQLPATLLAALNGSVFLLARILVSHDILPAVFVIHCGGGAGWAFTDLLEDGYV